MSWGTESPEEGVKRVKNDRAAFEAWQATLEGLSRFEVGKRVVDATEGVRRGAASNYFRSLDEYKVFEVGDDGAELRYLYAHWDLEEAKTIARMHRDLADAETVVKTHRESQRSKYRAKPVKNREKFQVMPDLTPEEYAALKEEVRRDGINVPIVTDKAGHILDGHNRFRIWRELMNEGADMTPLPLDVRTDLKTDKEKRDKAIALNLARRHLTREQKRVVVENILKAAPEKSNRQIAELTGVDHKTVGKYREELGSTGEIPQLKKTTGADGKARAAKKPKPEPTTDHTAVPADVADAYYPQAKKEPAPPARKPHKRSLEEAAMEALSGSIPLLMSQVGHAPPEEFAGVFLSKDGKTEEVDILADWFNKLSRELEKPHAGAPPRGRW